LSKLVEIIIEILLLNVKNVVLNEHKVIDSLIKFSEDSVDVGGHRLAAGVTDLDLLNFVELADRTGQVHNVLAAFGEGVEANEERVSRDLPRVHRLSLVIEVGVLELRAHIQSVDKLSVRITRLLLLDSLEDFLAVDVRATLQDNRIADLSDEDDEAGRRVIVV
jgi:hypothetical protein